jgi:hypothetical protein
MRRCKFIGASELSSMALSSYRLSIRLPARQISISGITLEAQQES